MEQKRVTFDCRITECSPLLNADSLKLDTSNKKDECFSTKIIPIHEAPRRRLERNRHNTQIRLNELLDKESLRARLREITKPVLKELEEEISCKSNDLPAFTQIPMKFTPREREYTLETICKSFDKFEEEEMINAIQTSSHLTNAVQRFMRHYDINKIRHERIMSCFAMGRKISQEDHTDDKINTEIENNINGVCFRRLKHK